MNRKHHSHAAHGSAGSDTDRAAHLSDHSEYRDLNFKAINQFLIGLAVIIAISYVAMYGIMKLFESQYEKNDVAPPPTANAAWERPTIDVQTAPNVDLREFEEEQQTVLMTSDPATRKLSIDEAIEATLQEGLPYRSGPPAVETAPALDNNDVGEDQAATAVETDTELDNNEVGTQ